MRKGRIFLNIFFALVWITGLVSCAPRMVSVQEESGLPKIKDIQVTEMPSKVEIRVFSDFPLLYTTFQLSDPDRLVVDLAGVDFGRFKSPIDVRQGDVLEIRPIRAIPPNDVSSLEILLSKPLESNVRVEDGILFIDLMKEKGWFLRREKPEKNPLFFWMIK